VRCAGGGRYVPRKTGAAGDDQQSPSAVSQPGPGSNSAQGSWSADPAPDQASDAALRFDKARQDAELLNHRYDQTAGLVWTPIAGALLPLEVAARPGAGDLRVNGDPSLQVAAAPAVSYVRTNAAQLTEQDAEWFSAHDIRIVQPWGPDPVGATPEDWAGTGVAVAAAVVSLLSGRMVRTDVALTGEMRPDGGLAPVSGFTARVLAAGKGSATRIVAPVGNEPDLKDVPQRSRSGLEFVFVTTIDEALHGALAKHRIKGYSLADATAGSPVLPAGCAQAVVISAEQILDRLVGVHTNFDGGHGFRYDLKLRVHYPDGSTMDIERQVGGVVGSELTYAPGAIIPMRYNPSDASKVEIDEDAMRAANTQVQRSVDETRVRAAEEGLRRQGW
jgi:hypothetical protein